MSEPSVSADLSGAGAGELDLAFRAVREKWDDEKAHEAFFALVSATRAYSDAARLYREVRDSDETKRALAEKKLTQIAFLAMASLDESHSEARKGLPPWAKWTIVVGVAVFMAWLTRRMIAG